MLRALSEFELGGVKSLLGFHRALLAHPCFAQGETCHGLVESELLAQQAEELSHRTTNVAVGSDGAARLGATLRHVEVGGRRFEVRILQPEPPWAELARRHADRERRGAAASDETVVSPMQGTVLKLEVAEGDAVEAGQIVAVVEAMKMENEITAHRSGTVAELAVEPGDPVSAGQTICVISD